MPGTINGFGTALWGKQNLRVYRDSCQACGRLGDLSSYDTREYFVALYLPLIPLARQRVFDECLTCNRYRTLTLKEWRSIRDRELAEAQAFYHRQPGDAAAALSLLGKVLTFGQEQDFLEVTQGVMERHGSNAEVLSVVGYGLDRWGHRGEAESVLRRSLELGEVPGARKHLAWLLVHGGRTDEAREFLAGAYGTRDASLLPSLCLLVEGLQAQGDHEGALRELEAIEAAWPVESQDVGLEEYRQTSLQHLQSGRNLVSPALKPLPVAAPGGRDWGGLFASLLSPVLLALILVPSFAAVVRAASSHEAHFVNGLKRPYQIRIGGDTVPLLAGGSAVHRIPRGSEVQVSGKGNGVDIEPFTVRAEVSFWNSLWGDKVLVINPDRCALLLQDHQMYIEDGADGNKHSDNAPSFVVRAGLAYYEFEDVDYVFRDFPNRIEMPNGEKVTWRSGLRILELPVISGWSLLASNDHEEEAKAWLLARLNQGLSDDEIEADLLAQSLDSDQFAEVAAGKLAERPFRVPWHRAYQGLLEDEGREEEARAIYRKALEEDLESGDCMYLLARVVADPEERLALLSASVRGPSPQPWPLYGAGFQELTEGRFETALDYIRRAMNLSPGSFVFASLESQALIGLGRYEELAERSIEERGGEANYQAMAQEILWLTAAKKTFLAEGVLQAAEAAVKEGGVDGEDFEKVHHWFEAWKFLGQGDLENYLKALAEGGEKAVLQEALLRADGEAFDEARQVVGGLNESQLLQAQLILAQTDPDRAETLLHEAIAILEGRGGDHKALAGLLASDEPVRSLSAVAQLPIQLETKAPALAILARRGGPAAADLRRLGRKLNFGPGFDAQLLARHLD